MTAPAPKFAYVPIGLIDLGPNVRTEPTGIDQLAASVTEHGVLEPVICCPHPHQKDRLELLVGQRRYLAARQAGLDHIPTLLRPRPSKRDRLIIQMVENFDRAPMSPMEEAFAFDQLRTEGVTRAQIARLTSRSASYIHERLLLLDLPEVIQAAIHAAWISPKTALAIPEAILEDPRELDAIEQTLRQGDQAVRTWITGRAARAGAARTRALTMFQQFNARLRASTILRIKDAAKTDGVSLNDWVEQVLADAADRVLAGEAVGA